MRHQWVLAGLRHCRSLLRTARRGRQPGAARSAAAETCARATAIRAIWSTAAVSASSGPAWTPAPPLPPHDRPRAGPTRIPSGVVALARKVKPGNIPCAPTRRLTSNETPQVPGRWTCQHPAGSRRPARAEPPLRFAAGQQPRPVRAAPPRTWEAPGCRSAPPGSAPAERPPAGPPRIRPSPSPRSRDQRPARIAVVQRRLHHCRAQQQASSQDERERLLMTSPQDPLHVRGTELT